MLTEETLIKHFSFCKSLQGINLTLEKLLLHTLHIHCTRATCVGKTHMRRHKLQDVQHILSHNQFFPSQKNICELCLLQYPVKKRITFS